MAERFVPQIVSKAASEAKEVYASSRDFFRHNARKVVLAIGIGGPAVLGAACGGNEGGAEISLVTQTPTATAEIPTATSTLAPTQTPEPTATPEPTPTPIKVVPLVEDRELKASLGSVFEGQSLPPGVCSLDMVNGLIDEVYALYRTDPVKSPQGGLATVYAHLIVLSENGNAQAAEVAERVRAGVVDVLIPENLKVKGLPATNAPEVVEAWDRNWQRKAADIRSASSCGIMLVPQDKKGPK